MFESRISIETDALNPLREVPSWVTPDFLLLRETHHRLMNSFAMMAAYLRLESRGASGSLPSQAVIRFADMINAQGELHRCLALRQTREPIPLDDYMIRLCRCLSDAVLGPLGITCDFAAEAGYLSAWQCERLGLATTELVVNAAKHAFGGRPGGKVRIDLHRLGNSWRCVIADNGSCLDPWAERASDLSRNKEWSLGSQIVESLIRTLGGTKITHSTLGGTIVVITIPGASSQATE